MSSRVMGMVFDRYPVGGSEFILALALADHASDDGTNIYPSVDYSATKARQSRRSVQINLRKMQSRGFITVVREAAYGRTREYRITPEWIAGGELKPLTTDHVPEGADSAPLPPVDNPDSDEKPGCSPVYGGAQNLTGGVQDDAQNMPQTAPKPCINHQEQGFNHQPAVVENPAPVKPPSLSVREKFERFWSDYPRHDQPGKAWQQFLKIDPDDALFGWIMRAIAHQKTTDKWKNDEGKWIPYAVNWLGKQQWKISKAARVDQGGAEPLPRLARGADSAPVADGVGASGHAYLGEMKKILGKG